MLKYNHNESHTPKARTPLLQKTSQADDESDRSAGNIIGVDDDRFDRADQPRHFPREWRRGALGRHLHHLDRHPGHAHGLDRACHPDRLDLSHGTWTADHPNLHRPRTGLCCKSALVHHARRKYAHQTVSCNRKLVSQYSGIL